MFGMDMLPTLVFLDRGVDLLLPGGVEGDPLDYLKAISSLAGVKALKDSLGSMDLNQELEVEAIDMDRLIDLILECESVIAL